MSEKIKNTVSLKLDGDVGLGDMVRACAAFESVVNSLTEAAGGKDKVHWDIDDAKGGSFYISAAGMSDSQDGLAAIETVERDLPRLVDDIMSGRASGFPAKAVSGVKKIRKILNGRITRAEFGSRNGREYLIPETNELTASPDVKPQSFGQISGRVLGINGQGHLQLTIITDTWPQHVVCHLPDDKVDDAGKWFNRFVTVTGIITRDTVSGRPKSVGQVQNIEFADVFDSEKLRGVIGMHRGELDTKNLDNWWDDAD